MPLISGVKKDIKTAQKMRLSWRGVLLVGVCTFIVAWALDQWGKLNLTLPLMNSVAVLGLVMAIKWEMRAYLWFWGATAVVTALLLSLIVFVPWGDRWVPAVAIAGIDSIGFCLILAVYAVAQKFCGIRAC